jgi:insulin-like growth factor-binding protein complex acid labile subunit
MEKTYAKALSKSGALILALSLSLIVSLGHCYDCRVGTEICNCEYIVCQNYNKNLELCDVEEYKKELVCDSTDYYFYPSEFCNLTTVSCLEIARAPFIPDLSSFSQDHLSLSIRYKVFTSLNSSWFGIGLNVTSLDFAYNHIFNITENAFDSLHGLKELNISINKLEEIKLNTLAELEVFDANRNYIKKIETDTFSVMPNLKVLILRYNYIESIAKGAFDFNVHLRKIDLKSNNVVHLDPLPGLDKMVCLDLDENELVKIENGTFENLKSLKTLIIRNNNIEQVDANAFAGLTELRKIRIGSNKIKSLIRLDDSVDLTLFSMIENLVEIINDNSFANFNKSVSRINVSWNKIQAIDDFAFNLEMLTILDLTGNFIYTLNSSDIFYGLANLKELFLSRNVLMSLLPFKFEYLVNLNVLDLNDNFIEEIQNSSFFGLTSLIALSLRGNRLTKLNNSDFMYLNNVTRLELDSNRLRSIGKNSFLNMDSLTVLSLSNNKLSFIKKNYFAGLTKLEELDLSCNQISSIHVNSFNSLVSLNLLDLTDNNIFALDPRIFSNMHNLEKLNLQSNVIYSINNQTFMFAGNLTELNLSNNLMTVLKPGIFSALSKLLWLNVENNPIQQIYLDSFVDLINLVYLNFRNDIKLKSTTPSSFQKDLFLPKLDSLFFNFSTKTLHSLLRDLVSSTFQLFHSTSVKWIRTFQRN